MHRLANRRNNLFSTKIRRQQVSQDLPTHLVLNNHVQVISRIATRISTNLEEQNLLPTEQKGCHLGSKRYKDQLMTSKAIYEDCKMRNMNLSIACIHYQKAFGSFPHS